MKKVILIGGSGFLGSNLLQYLLKEKIDTLVVVNKTQIKNTKGLQKIEGGISAINKDLLDEFKPDVIFHCARPTLPRFRKIGRILAAKKAFRLNKKLLITIRKAKHKPKLVFASGSLMYGNSNITHDELSPLRPISYAKQYSKGEIPINKAVAKNTFPVIVLRFPWLLGNGSWFKWFYLENIKKLNVIPEIGNMENLMEIIDVRDAAKLMMQYAEGISNSGIFNIYKDEPITQHEFLIMIKNEFGVSSKEYKDLFQKEPEKEAIEAFSSNIKLSTKYRKILNAYSFSSISETLKDINKESKVY